MHFRISSSKRKQVKYFQAIILEKKMEKRRREKKERNLWVTNSKNWIIGKSFSQYFEGSYQEKIKQVTDSKN